MDQIVLASASPRRRRLVRWLGLPFTTAASDVEDDPHGLHGERPVELARQLALAKARHVAERPAFQDGLVLGFDTVVVVDGDVLGKPSDRREARQMLETLAGRMHEVVTGVAAVGGSVGARESFAHTTPVLMKGLDAIDLEAWLTGDEVLGCAGAYNIERHLAGVTLDECFQNVAGLPLCHTYLMLKQRCGLEPSRPDTSCNAARRVRCRLAQRLLGDDGRE